MSGSCLKAPELNCKGVWCVELLMGPGAWRAKPAVGTVEGLRVSAGGQNHASLFTRLEPSSAAVGNSVLRSRSLDRSQGCLIAHWCRIAASGGSHAAGCALYKYTRFTGPVCAIYRQSKQSVGLEIRMHRGARPDQVLVQSRL